MNWFSVVGKSERVTGYVARKLAQYIVHWLIIPLARLAAKLDPEHTDVDVTVREPDA